jgi:hypothetical protein
MVRVAAIDTYVRRAYRGYSLEDFQHHFDSELFMFHWTYSSDRDQKHLDAQFNNSIMGSTIDLRSIGNHRTGILCLANDITEIKQLLTTIFDWLENRLNETSAQSYSLTIAIGEGTGMHDRQLDSQMEQILSGSFDELQSHRVRRVTFLVVRHPGVYPGYFTFRRPALGGMQYEEDITIRKSFFNIDFHGYLNIP